MMNNKTLKSLTDAHAWIGLIISTVLFIVFFAGSISLFRENINAWEKLPIAAQQVKHIDSIEADYDKAITNISDNYDVYVEHLFYLTPPKPHYPFISAFFAKNIEGIDPETGEDHADVHLVVDPQTGEILGDGDQFEYGDFIYQLHYNLGLGSTGLYFVGLITLFFFVAVLSGLVIHWRKLFKNFFQYRKDKSKDKWLDAHNIIGTMGLPFHIMYAFTGLVFNLVIVYQISYALILYQGDQERLLAAAGYSEPHININDIERPITNLNEIVKIAKQDMGDQSMGDQDTGNVVLKRIMIDHFGDDSAVAIFRADRADRFATETAAHYRISTGERIYLTRDNYDNSVRSGLGVIASLHFGDFAGYGLRIAFFLMGLATCYVILTGNLVWIDKREKMRQQSQGSLNFVRRMTSGGFGGVVLATAIGFTASRALPVELLNRTELIETSFYIIFFITLICAQLIKNQTQFICAILKLSASAFIAAIALDWVMLFSNQLTLLSIGIFDVIITEIMLLVLALICVFAAYQVRKKSRINQLKYSESTSEVSMQVVK
jgi:uncharacterized iron-regulated membrane protein